MKIDKIGLYSLGTLVVAGGGYAGWKYLWPKPPKALAADAGGPYTIQEGIPLALYGSASGGEKPYSYAWDFDGDGQYETPGQNPSHTWPAAGSYTVSLKVTDSKGNQDTDTATVTVTAAAEVGAEIISYTVSPTSGVPGDAIVASVTFRNTGPEAHQFDVVGLFDGPSGWGAVAQNVYLASGASTTVQLPITIPSVEARMYDGDALIGNNVTVGDRIVYAEKHVANMLEVISVVPAEITGLELTKA